MIRTSIATASAAGAVLALAACGDAPEAGEPPATTERAPIAGSWTACESPSAGFTVRHPTGWHTASLRPHDACRRFHPDPLGLVDGTDCCPWALEVHPSDEPLERVLADYGDPLYYRVLAREDLGDEPRTVRLTIVTTGEGLYDEGTRIYAYLREAGDGTIAVQTTAARGESRYREWTRVVDEAARTLIVEARRVESGEVAHVFFANERLQRDPSSCSEVFARERPVGTGLGAEERLAVALTRLLEGPTPAERTAGYSSWFSRETAGMLRAVKILDSVARVDFDDFSALLNGANTSCGSAALMAALDATVKGAAGDGREPVYSFRGDCAAFYEWLQALAPECAPVAKER